MAMLLAAGEMLLFWAGHSPRHFLTQAALSLGVTKERRDYLGRWSIGRVGSNAYIHSARQVVEEVQVEVLQALVKGTAVIDEGELLDEIAQFADEHGLIGHRIKRRHTHSSLDVTRHLCFLRKKSQRQRRMCHQKVRVMPLSWNPGQRQLATQTEQSSS